MIASIISRSFGKDGDVKLSLRLATPSLKNAIALDITVNKDNWELINKSLKYYAKAYRRGADFEVDSGLKSKLWTILKTVDSLYASDQLTIESAKAVVKKVLREEAIKELEQSNVLKESEPEQKSMLLIEWIDEFIRQCETGERLKQKSIKLIKNGTIKGWKTTMHRLQAYQKARHCVLGFDDMTLDFLDDFRNYLIREQYTPNTIARHIKALKRFLSAAKEMKLTTCLDFESGRWSVTFIDVDNVYLTEDRVQQLYDIDMTDEEQVKTLLNHFKGSERKELEEATERENSRDALQHAKDVFVVGCLTGQRFSDYSRIKESMITRLRDGNDYINISQVKTEKEVFLPLDPRVLTILNRYNGKLPKVYEQKVNRGIKIVCHLLGWTEDAGITERKGVMEYDSGKKFYECVKTHTARRTFATNAYKRGVSLASIMAVTGHSSEQMLRKYLKLDNKERAILAAAEFQKVVG